MQLEEDNSFTNNLGTLNRSRKLKGNKTVASKAAEQTHAISTS
jgi:hypothetical protein